MSAAGAETVPAVVARAAARWPDTEAIADGDRRVTFAQLGEHMTDASRALIGWGLEPGDRAAIWAPNSTDWILAALGVLGAGGSLVTVNTRFKRAETHHVLRASGARLLLTVTDLLGTDLVDLLGDTTDLPELRTVAALDRLPAGDGPAPWQALLGGAPVVDPTAAARRAAAVSPGDTAAVLFTSGTTGAPKGAMLAHGAAVAGYTAWASVVGLRAGDRYLVVNPFFHCFGLMAGILAAIIEGATIIPHAVFDVPEVMRRVAQERVTVLPGPPAIYQSILDHPDARRFDLSSLRLAVTGGAPVPVELIRRMRGELGFDTVVTGYGLTEATGIATMCRHDDPPEVVATTAGRPIPGVEVRVVGAGGDDCAPDDAGEVWVRGFNVMQGYIGDPVATAEAVRPDGWLRTGDIGVVGRDGNLRITDRLKDVVIVGGFNVYPAEVEAMIAEHPAVSQAAVVGTPDGRLGEVTAVFVVPRASAVIDPAELIGWCRERMGNYKVPRHVHVVEDLPRNAGGKVLKYQLRDRLVGGR